MWWHIVILERWQFSSKGHSNPSQWLVWFDAVTVHTLNERRAGLAEPMTAREDERSWIFHARAVERVVCVW
jgi:hypothetical protein